MFNFKREKDQTCSWEHFQYFVIGDGPLNMFIAMHQILLQDKPDDFVIATGKSTSLEKFYRYNISVFNLDYKDFLSY